MTPEEMDVLLVTIRSVPVAVRALEVAAEAVDNGYVDEAVDLLRDAAEVVIDEHPMLLVSVPTLQAIMGAIVGGMRATQHPYGT